MFFSLWQRMVQLRGGDPAIVLHTLSDIQKKIIKLIFNKQRYVSSKNIYKDRKININIFYFTCVT